MSTIPRTLFVGQGPTPISWYRCALPAMALGADWIAGTAPGAELHGLTGVAAGGGTTAVPTDYDVVVVQLAMGRDWLHAIRAWQEAGVVVLYEVDDWVRGVRRNAHHDFRDVVDRSTAEAGELCMRVCDGVICSTEWLARRYRSVNPNTFVCRNGIDLKRYALTRPARESVAIGWAGATGHRGGVEAWLQAVTAVMRRHPDTRFVSVGQPFADVVLPEFGAARALSVPFAPLETYPATMALFDVALAPAGRGSFFRGKSDLRWLEASALGIPLIADPEVYPEIEHGVTGFHAADAAEAEPLLAELVADEGLRTTVGEAARAYVTEHRRVEVAARDWADVLTRSAAAVPVSTA